MYLTAETGADLDPETSAAPQPGNTGRPSLPRPTRGAPDRPLAPGHKERPGTMRTGVR